MGKDPAKNGEVFASEDGLSHAWESEWQEGSKRVFGWRFQTHSPQVAKELGSLKGTTLNIWSIKGSSKYTRVYVVPYALKKAALRAAGILIPSGRKRKKALAGIA